MFARLPVLALALISPALPVAATQAPPPPRPIPAPPPPPIDVIPFGEPRAPMVLTWQASDVTCGAGERVAPSQFVAPDPQPALIPQAVPPEPVVLRFTLDAEGRAQDITATLAPRYRSQMADLMPSLRASRFRSGGARTGCTISYTASTQTIADAPLETLARLGVAQRLRLGKEVSNRLAPGDCLDPPRLAPLSRSYPDWRKLDRREGTRNWTYVTYDVDPDGVPVNVATAYTSGHDALDAEARAAVAAGRFAGGPRKGCIQTWWTGAAAVAAPPKPLAAEAEGNPACKFEDRWAREPRRTYPASYRQRGVEGWAVLRFDVAPWGDIGAIEVVSAQPSSEFGEAALSVIRTARFKPLDSGLKGCVETVAFRMPSEPGESGGDGAGEGEVAPN